MVPFNPLRFSPSFFGLAFFPVVILLHIWIQTSGVSANYISPAAAMAAAASSSGAGGANWAAAAAAAAAASPFDAKRNAFNGGFRHANMFGHRVNNNNVKSNDPFSQQNKLPDLRPDQLAALAQFWSVLRSKSSNKASSPQSLSIIPSSPSPTPVIPLVATSLNQSPIKKIASLQKDEKMSNQLPKDVEALPGLSQFLASIGKSGNLQPFQNLKTDPLNIYSMTGHPLFQNPAGCPPGCAHTECTFLGCPRCRKGLYLYNYNRIYICVNQCPDGFKITDGACTTGKPVLVGYIGDKKDLRDVYFPLSDTQSKWREDGRCGPDHPVEGTTAASECDPAGEDPCCSVHGWCGRTREHCTCVGCKDYSGKKGAFFKGKGGWDAKKDETGVKKSVVVTPRTTVPLPMPPKENRREDRKNKKK